MSATFSMSGSERSRHLDALDVGARGVVVGVAAGHAERAERLMALGVTRGARVRMLQRFPGFVFECDQTELAVEPAVAREILVLAD